MEDHFNYFPRWPVRVALPACLLAAILLVALPVIKFDTLHSSFYDLGQYATFHYGLLAGDWASLFRSHAHPIAVFYALIYAIAPSNLTLVVMQSAIVTASVGLYVAYWVRLRLPTPVVGALVYLISFPVWFAAFFEFHFEHLIFPLIFGFFLSIESASRLRGQSLAISIAVLLCLVKEPYALMAVMLGIYVIAAKRWFLVGASIVLISMTYFFVVTQLIIPHFSNGAQTGELWRDAFGYLGASTTQIAETILVHPWALIADILTTPRKLLYLFALFGSFAFLPLLRPLALLPAVPVIAISLLSHNPNHYYLGHQYTMPVTAVALVAAAQALTRLRPAARTLAIGAMFIAGLAAQMAFGPSPISRLFWSKNIFNYHRSAYVMNAHDRELSDAIRQLVPPDDDLLVSTQNAINTDRLTNRRKAYAYPDGVFAPVDVGGGRSAWADVVVLDRQRPLSFRDEICLFDRQHICDDQKFEMRFDDLQNKLREDFDILYDANGIMIARRKIKKL